MGDKRLWKAFLPSRENQFNHPNPAYAGSGRFPQGRLLQKVHALFVINYATLYLTHASTQAYTWHIQSGLTPILGQSSVICKLVFLRKSWFERARDGKIAPLPFERDLRALTRRKARHQN